MALLVWELLTAAYLFLAGLGAGSYIISAIADIKGKGKYEGMARFGAHLSWPLVAIGLILLILHMGRPELNNPVHILGIFTNYTSSMLSIEALLMGGVIVVGAATSFFWLAKWKKVWLRTVIEIIGSIVAFAAIISSGLVLTLSSGIPFWESPFLPWVFTVSSMLSALALVGLTETHLGSLLFPRFNIKPEVATLKTLTLYSSTTIIVEIITMALFLAHTYITGNATEGISILTTGSLSLIFWSMLGLGLILPLLLGYMITRRAKSLSTETSVKILALITFVCLIAGGFLLRYTMLFAGQL